MKQASDKKLPGDDKTQFVDKCKNDTTARQDHLSIEIRPRATRSTWAFAANWVTRPDPAIDLALDTAGPAACRCAV